MGWTMPNTDLGKYKFVRGWFFVHACAGHSVSLYEPQDVQRIMSWCTCPSSACIRTLPQ